MGGGVDGDLKNPADLVWDLTLLQRVLSHPTVDVVKTISGGIRRQVAMCVSELLRAVVERPNDEKGYVRLFLFPRSVLRNLPQASNLRRKKRWFEQRKFTLRCLNDWNAGGSSRDDLVRAVLSREPSRPRGGKSTMERNLRRCEKIAREDGQFGKAIKSLGSHGVAPFSPETTQALRDLHPEGDPVAIRSSFPEGFEISRDDGLVLDVLRSFKKGTASGRSGWGVNHLLECCSHQTGVSDVEKHLTAFVNLFLSGKALQSFAPFMSSATLVPLLKKDGRIRPVAVGEIFRRLVSKCCVKGFADQAARQLCPLQVGVGVPNGAECLLHTFNRFIRDPALCDDDTAMVFVDFENAFNRVSRQAMLEEVVVHLPRFYGWVQYSYGVGAKLFAGSDLIEATSGVQQGDPLGPLLFAMVLQPLLKRIRSGFSLVTGAYLDDLTLAGPSRQVAEALQWLRREGPSRGLRINIAKTIVWSPLGRDLTSHGLFRGYVYSRHDGVELLGGAVSKSAAFISTVVSKRVDKCIESLHRMLALEDPQLCLMLLRACEGMPKLMYCWRTVLPEFLTVASTRFTAEITEALRAITVADGPHLGGFQVRLATLPVSMGGLGIYLPADITNFAYAASFLSSFGLQQRILGLRDHLVPTMVVDLVQTYTEKVSDNRSQATELATMVLARGTQSLENLPKPLHNLQI